MVTAWVDVRDLVEVAAGSDLGVVGSKVGATLGFVGESVVVLSSGRRVVTGVMRRTIEREASGDRRDRSRGTVGDDSRRRITGQNRSAWSGTRKGETYDKVCEVDTTVDEDCCEKFEVGKGVGVVVGATILMRE